MVFLIIDATSDVRHVEHDNCNVVASQNTPITYHQKKKFKHNAKQQHWNNDTNKLLCKTRHVGVVYYHKAKIHWQFRFHDKEMRVSIAWLCRLFLMLRYLFNNTISKWVNIIVLAKKLYEFHLRTHQVSGKNNHIIKLVFIMQQETSFIRTILSCRCNYIYKYNYMSANA